MRFKLKKTYMEDLKLFPYKADMAWYGLLLMTLLLFPLVAGHYWI
jgi:hypothetical protein